MDITVTTLEEVEQIIQNNIGAILYFSTPTCNICKALRPKIMQTFQENFTDIKRVYINSVDSPEVSSKYNVFAVPTILVFLDTKEFARESRNLSIHALVEKISRPYSLFNS